jgi:uncharacterized membrane protein YjjP (DUF1212 family)
MSDISLNKVVELAIQTGQLMLESGAETHKVEEVMHATCQGFGYQESSGYVTLTGIFLSVKDTEGKIVTSIKRIESRVTDLERISRISQLSAQLFKRNCAPIINLRTKPMSYDEYSIALMTISETKTYPPWVKFISGGLSCGCFTMLFGGSWRQFAVAIPVGIIVKMLLTILNRTKLNNFLLNALGAGLVVWLAKMAVTNIGLMSSDKIIIGGIMLLVPGLSMTNAIRDTMAGDLVAGTARAVEAFFISVAIATGAGTMLKIWSLLV